MKSNYKRVTDIGYNTGKVVIGGHYIPPKKQATSSEVFICGVLRGTERISLWSTITSQLAAKFRLLKVRVRLLAAHLYAYSRIMYK